MTGASFTFDAELLKPLITSIVAETIAAVEVDRAKLGERLAYGEREAAALLGLRVHQLRDMRTRGEIQASLGPGRKILYSRGDLLAFLSARRINKDKSHEAD
jgi:hypothetical protein